MTDREAFEAHIRSLNATTHLGRQQEAVGGQYRTITVERNWQLWQAATKHEREECAKVGEDRSVIAVNRSVSLGCDREIEMAAALEANACAAAIRTRGE